MTEITDTEAAEVLWASSEQGKAAVMAACRKADDLGLPGTCGRPPAVIEPADISAIVYAAFIAAGWDAEPAEDDERPAHDHQWAILGRQPHTPTVLFGQGVPHTIVLIRCSECGEPDTRMLPGEWTLEDLTGGGNDARCTHCGEAREHPDHIVTRDARGGHVFAAEGEQR